MIKRDELYHHGILGQKWGIRRFQNEDGTLTKAGVKRVKKAMKAAMKVAEIYEMQAVYKTSKGVKKAAMTVGVKVVNKNIIDRGTKKIVESLNSGKSINNLGNMIMSNSHVQSAIGVGQRALSEVMPYYNNMIMQVNDIKRQWRGE